MRAMIRVFVILMILAWPGVSFAGASPAVTFQPQQAALPKIPSPVVLELFTSQGCAYCPPADALMEKLAAQPGVIGLSCHVDYFAVRGNDLGKGFCTGRQNDYNRLFSGSLRYTPQLVVNGRTHVIGYEKQKIGPAILKARAQKILPIALNRAPKDGYYYFSLPALGYENGNLRLGMFVYDAPKKIVMTDGNNFGKTITYTNVVSRFEDLGLWDGQESTRTINAFYGPQNAGIAVIVQNIATGEIIAAGKATR
jgi:hypothetical protein